MKALTTTDFYDELQTKSTNPVCRAVGRSVVRSFSVTTQSQLAED